MMIMIAIKIIRRSWSWSSWRTMIMAIVIMVIIIRSPSMIITQHENILITTFQLRNPPRTPPPNHFNSGNDWQSKPHDEFQLRATSWKWFGGGVRGGFRNWKVKLMSKKTPTSEFFYTFRTGAIILANGIIYTLILEPSKSATCNWRLNLPDLAKFGQSGDGESAPWEAIKKTIDLLRNHPIRTSKSPKLNEQISDTFEF